MEESGVESGEVSPGAKAKTTEARPARPEASLRDFNAEARLGRSIFRLAADREEQRLTSYLDTRNFSKENLAALGERTGEEPITQEEVQKAKEASFGIALEAATQIAEVRLPRGRGVNEDLESLEKLGAFIQQGNRLMEELEKDNPALVREQAKEVMARRLRKRPEELKNPDAQLDSFAQEQFQGALRRLGRAAGALRAYFGR